MRGNDVTVSVPVVETRSWIDGRWSVPDHEIGSLHDPNTGARRGPQRENSTESVTDAIAAADRLFTAQILDDLGPASRAAALGEWASLLDDAAEDIALQDSLSTGNPLSTTRMLAGSLGARVRSLAAEVLNLGDGKELPASGRTVRLLNRSLGPTLILAPWNAPTFVAVSKLAAAFGAGSPSILKPSEWTPAGAQIAFALFVQVLDARALPAASVQLVHGGAGVGSALTSDPRVRVITFTGGLAAGRAVARAAAESLANVQLELGSNNPAVVLEGADVERTASDLIAGMTRLNGQWCEAPGKVLVPRSMHDTLTDALVAEAERIRIMHSLEPDCDLGPLAYEAHRDRLEASVAGHEARGAQVRRIGTKPAADGWFFAPAVITGLPAAAASEELFGPAVTVHPYDDVADAISDANAAGGGLDAFVFGADEDEAIHVGGRLLAGEVRVNGTKMADLAGESQQTFWGTSGVGGHGPAQGVAFYQGRRVVGVDDPTLPI
ncbi:phenylacetaldehyde dehydrogenase [Microbacterium esteraromaticum]|jgi:phenylacetaldehyde dehydrogenase|nr:phenylacetaldehyde dehydrogenase [Microbacterium esteraromaticum]